MRTKVNHLNEIDLNDTHFMNDVAIIVVNDIDEILEFKEKAPLFANEFCISYREYNYEVDYMILIHKTVLAPIFANCCDLSNIAYDTSLIYLPTPRFYTINDAIINYVNVDREDECQFYTVDNWEYDNHIGFYPKPLFTNIKNN